MTIPIDLRQFGMKTIFVATTSIAIAFALMKIQPYFGFYALLTTLSFWIGLGFMFLSDLIDSRPIDERKIGSQSLNFLGLIFVGASFVGFCFCLVGVVFFLVFLIGHVASSTN